MNIELDKAVCHFKTDFPETRIVKSMLADLFPKEGAERNLLTIIYDSGYVEKLASMPQCTQNNIDAAVSAIMKETFLSEQPVREALSMWLVVYGKNVPMTKVECKHENSHFQKDSSEKEKFNLENVKVGSTIKFGRYVQNKRDKSDLIEWRVLTIENDKALLISQYALDCKQYDGTSWEECSLRKWLNNDFLNSAFSSVEQDMILLSDITADENPEYKGTNQGYDAEDKVFLLSIKEVEMYFYSDEERTCKPTKHAVCKGAFIDEDNGKCVWQLRSQGVENGFVTCIDSDGSIIYCGSFEGDDSPVRPALWVNIKS